MLLISDRKHIKILEDYITENPLHKAEILSQWVKKSFNMTAMLDEHLMESCNTDTLSHPSSSYYSNLQDKKWTNILVKSLCNNTSALPTV